MKYTFKVKAGFEESWIGSCEGGKILTRLCKYFSDCTFLAVYIKRELFLLQKHHADHVEQKTTSRVVGGGA